MSISMEDYGSKISFVTWLIIHKNACIIDHIRMVEQVYFVVHEAIIEELYMEYTDSANFAINFEVIE